MADIDIATDHYFLTQQSKAIDFALYRSISNYFIILVKILEHDIFPFLVVFGTFLLAATVGLFLEQRLDARSLESANNTQNP